MYSNTATTTFIAKYPFDAKMAIFTPMIFQAKLAKQAALPLPTLEGIRDLARFAGISDSAIRTALSRAKAEGTCSTLIDDRGVNRYQINQSYFDEGSTTLIKNPDATGFLLAVFSFAREDVSERTVVRETLKNCGFKKLAQNTYINGMIDTAPLMKKMKALGLDKNLFLFPFPDLEDISLVEKILDIFDITGRKRVLGEFLDDLTAFFSDTVSGKAGTADMANRILYAGPIYWDLCNIQEPPFPAKHLPHDYPLPRIRALYADCMKTNFGVLVDHYLKVNA